MNPKPLREFALVMPAGMTVQFRPLEAGYPTVGAKCALIFARADEQPFDREDVQLICAYLLKAIDTVSVANESAPPVSDELQPKTDTPLRESDEVASTDPWSERCEMPGCTAPKGHEHDVRGRTVVAPDFEPRDEPTPEIVREHLPRAFSRLKPTGTDVLVPPTASEEQQSDEIVDVPPELAAKLAHADESSLPKKPLTHAMALESQTGTACFYCHELDPSEEHLEKCRALDAATKQVQGETKERPS